MSATADQELAELRRANEELLRERDAALAALARRNTEYGERIEYQAATIDVLKAMSASPGDPQPVFDLIVKRARDLCDAYGATVYECDGTLIHYRAATGVSDDAGVRAQVASVYPIPPTRYSGPGRAILDRRIIRIDDMESDAGLHPILRHQTAKSAVFLPLLRGGMALGALALGRRERGGFSDTQIQLLQTFAEQAVIAITSAETYRALQERTQALGRRNSEYGERIEQQTATIDVLKAISASPGNARPVFKLIVDRARAFCEADHATTALLRDGMLHLQAFSGMSADYVKEYVSRFPRPVDLSTMFGRAILAREAVQVPYVQADPAHFASQIASFADFHTVVGVPMLRGGEPIGAIALGRRAPGGITETQIELLKTFADQAVIAISSAETYRALQSRTDDLQESLEYQTATSDVLKAISSSDFELDPVFQAVVETATRLCRADQAVIYRYHDGFYRWAAGTSLLPDYEEIERGVRIAPSTGTLVGRVALERRTIEIPDALADPLYEVKNDAIVGGIRTLLGVPLMRDETPIGVIGLARQRIEAFTERQIELVRTFADQAVIAIENARLVAEQREALEQQIATAEVLQVVNASPGDLEPVFDAILEKAHKLCGATLGSLQIYDGDYIRFVAVRGAPEALLSILRKGIPRPNTPAIPLDRTSQVADSAELLARNPHSKRMVPSLAESPRLGVRFDFLRTSRSPCWKTSPRRR
jgi:GAF domain-containing protein